MMKRHHANLLHQINEKHLWNKYQVKYRNSRRIMQDFMHALFLWQKLQSWSTICCSITLFAWFSSIWLLTTPKCQNFPGGGYFPQMTSWKQQLTLFGGPRTIKLLRSDKSTAASLDQVCWITWRLCWNIKMIPARKSLSLSGHKHFKLP